MKTPYRIERHNVDGTGGRLYLSDARISDLRRVRAPFPRQARHDEGGRLGDPDSIADVQPASTSLMHYLVYVDPALVDRLFSRGHITQQFRTAEGLPPGAKLVGASIRKRYFGQGVPLLALDFVDDLPGHPSIREIIPRFETIPPHG